MSHVGNPATVPLKSVPMSGVGDEIKAARRAQRLTIRQVAEETRRLGTPVHVDTISRIERGEVDHPRPETLDVLHEILKLGEHAPAAVQDRSRDLRVADASFSELMAAATSRYHADMREALGAGTQLHAIDEVPADVLERARNGTIPSGRPTPNEGHAAD